MLLVSFFYIAYVVSAVKAKPDWGLAFSNLFYPHGVEFTPEYLQAATSSSAWAWSAP